MHVESDRLLARGAAHGEQGDYGTVMRKTVAGISFAHGLHYGRSVGTHRRNEPRVQEA